MDLEISKLFKRIAFKTHPDRVDDPEAHALFVFAKELRDKKDLKGLQELWDLLTGKKDRLESRMQRRLAELRAEVSGLRARLSYLKASDDFKIVQFFEQDKYSVLVAARRQLENHQAQLYEHARVLKSLLGFPTPTTGDYV